MPTHPGGRKHQVPCLPAGRFAWKGHEKGRCKKGEILIKATGNMHIPQNEQRAPMVVVIGLVYRG